MNIKIFIINLKKSTDRRKFIHKQLLKADFDSEFIEACEPNEVSARELEESNLNKPYDYEMSKEDIACSRSHARAIKALAHDETCTHGLIIEDDVYLSRNLSQILTQLKKSHGSESIVLLCGLIFNPIKFQYVSDLCLGHGLVRPDHYKFCGAQAYFLSKEKAKDVAERLLPVTLVADDWGNFLSRNYFSDLYLVYPFPAVHAELMSVRNMPNSAGLRTVVKNLILKYKIFPFYHIFFAIRLRSAEFRQKNNIHAPDFKSKKTYKL